MKKYLLLIFSLGLAACSAFDDAEYAKLVELAPASKEYYVDKAGGTASVKIYSNGKVKVRALNDFSAYCTIDRMSFKDDGDLLLEFQPNEGFRRMAKLEVSLEGESAKDTVYVRQYGDEPYLECAAPYKNVSGSGTDVAEFEIGTNVPLDNLDTKVSYLSGGKDWIRSIYSELGMLVAETSASSVEHTSKAQISISYVDGWDVRFNVNLYVTSSNKDGEFGSRISFAQAREYAGAGKIEDDVFIEGVVVSDFHSANMALNPSVNYDKVDISQNKRTAYIQSSDASMGFRLLFTDADDNILARGTKLSLSLTGLKIVKEEDPERYTIDGIGGENMVGSESGDFIVSKEKTISELTDDDVFTFVALKNTEFVYKTGAYANVYENYTLASAVNSMNSGNNNRLDGWAALLIDDSGKGIYAPINMLCLWRRSGNGVPQGKGFTEGIIVSEPMSRYGDVGPYQIRVLDESGFRQEWNGASAYTEFAKYDGAPYQYRYGQWAKINSKYADPGSVEARLTNTIIPSDDLAAGHTVPNVEMFIENHSPGDGNWPMSSVNSYSNLTGEEKGIVPSSVPVSDYRKALSLATEIKGWYDWEDGRITGYKGMRMEMSTSALSGSMMYVHYAFDVGAISAATSQFFPAHWCLEYSIDGGNSYTLCKDNVTGKDYVHLRTLPWWDITLGGIKYFTSSSCGLGATQHVAVLPAEVFGKDKLLIRIRPYDNVMAVFPIEWDGDSEHGTVEHNTTVKATKINFECINIRYK